MIEDLVSRVFGLRNAAHLAHFSTKSYAQHMALGDFYDGLIDKIDTIVEAYQGTFGLIGDVTTKDVSPKNIVETIADEAAWISSNRENLAHNDDMLMNLIDDLVALYAKTFYKLRNLA